MHLFVTGGAGFIGSNFIRHILATYPNYRVTNFDALTYAGNPANLADIASDKRYIFIKGDIRDAAAVDRALASNKPDAIINFAAETHVDRSIKNAGDFILTDVLGTFTLLDAIRQHNISKFIQISTDEVYGDMHDGAFARETDLLKPSSPYAASKAGGDLQVIAAHRTYGLPVMITRCTNNYGPFHYPEKIIPLFITNALESLTGAARELPVYDDGSQIRDWLFVTDHCRAIDLVLHKGTVGEIYNVGAGQQPEITNLELTRTIIRLTGASEKLITYKKGIRPGHDQRYAVDTAKIRALGWAPRVTFEEGIAQTVDWFRAHESWWKPIKSGEFAAYYKEHYGKNS